MISVVIETWNATDRLTQLLGALVPQVGDVDVVITHAGIAPTNRDQLERVLGRPITWVELAADAGYYEHKNRGFDASRGEVVAFIDGDCDPTPMWLASLTQPIVDGTARVVAGATSYPGALAALANPIDFPYFDQIDARRCTIEDAPHAVRNFFANNVAFARAEFAARRYPTIEPMFHGQCQILGLQLLADGIQVRFAPEARITHAWPDGVREFLEVRLLRGADSVSLLPYVLATYAPRTVPAVTKLGALPTLALLGIRALTSSWSALKHGPRLRGLGFIACTTILDAIGASTAPAVYRYLT